MGGGDVEGGGGNKENEGGEGVLEKKVVKKVESWEWDDETQAKYWKTLKLDQEMAWEQAKRGNARGG